MRFLSPSVSRFWSSCRLLTEDRSFRFAYPLRSAKSESVSGDAGPAGSTSQVAGQKRGRTTSDGTVSRKGKKAKKETLAPIPDSQFLSSSCNFHLIAR